YSSLSCTVPSIRPDLNRIRGLWCDRFRCPVGKRNNFFRCRSYGLTRRIWIVGRSLPARPLTHYTTQAQDKENSERQKKEVIDIEHVSHAFGYRGHSPAGFAYDQVPSIGTAAVASVVGRLNPWGGASRGCFGAIQVSQPTLDDQGA